jgi:enoyl-[acyl-carrier protein] reductase I
MATMTRQEAFAPIVDLRGKRGLVFGIANDRSIATGCARALVAAGAQVAASYLNDKALPYVTPVADALGLDLVGPCDLRIEGQLEAVFADIAARITGTVIPVDGGAHVMG